MGADSTLPDGGREGRDGREGGLDGVDEVMDGKWQQRMAASGVQRLA